MKVTKSLLFGTALCFAPIVGAQAAEPTIPNIEPRPFVLNNSQQFDLKSQINGRVYRIFLSVPQGEAPAEGFPIIYTTDGNAMFPQITATANLLGMTNRAVIVGIGYPNDELYNMARRTYDLTWKTAEGTVGPVSRNNAVLESGGNDIFVDFIEKELKPLIQARAKINRQKQTLFGHSYGGLFTLYVLFNRPETFQNYVAAAPSVWWDNGSILQQQKAFLDKYKNQKLQLKVLITANTDPSRRRPTPAQAEKSDAAILAENKNTRQAAVESSGAIIDALKTLEGVTGEYRVFESETHISMAPSSINSGLRFAVGDSPRSQAAPPVYTPRGGTPKTQ